MSSPSSGSHGRRHYPSTELVYLEVCRHLLETGQRPSVSWSAWAAPSFLLCVWPEPPARPPCGCLHNRKNTRSEANGRGIQRRRQQWVRFKVFYGFMGVSCIYRICSAHPWPLRCGVHGGVWRQKMWRGPGPPDSGWGLRCGPGRAVHLAETDPHLRGGSRQDQRRHRRA